MARKRILDALLRFDTPRFVKIENKKVGTVFRLLQLVILLYVIGFVLIYQHGYQSEGRVYSSVVTKVKGVTFSNYSDEELAVEHPELYRRVWDPSDYIFPAHGGDNGGFFLMTNVVITPNQTQSRCPEDPIKVKRSECQRDSDCKPNYSIDTGNGVQTGKCVPSVRLPGTKTCEIFAWCPVEQDILPLKGKKALLSEAHEFKVLIKNTVSFPKFGSEFLKRNILENANETYLRNCLYERSHKENRFCPIFQIKDIVGSVDEFNQVAVQGAVFVIRIKWNCNLDINFSNCHPHYDFQRMDNKKAKIAPGWNFRFAEYQGPNQRTLYKFYGIKFVVEVSGKGRKFNIIPLFINIGSGLGLLGLAQVFAGLVVSIVMKDKLEEIKEKKYIHVEHTPSSL